MHKFILSFVEQNLLKKKSKKNINYKIIKKISCLDRNRADSNTSREKDKKKQFFSDSIVTLFDMYMKS